MDNFRHALVQRVRRMVVQTQVFEAEIRVNRNQSRNSSQAIRLPCQRHDRAVFVLVLEDADDPTTDKSRRSCYENQSFIADFG